MRATRLVALTVVSCVLLITLPAAAQDADLRSSNGAATPAAAASASAASPSPDWGTGSGIHQWIPASAFQPRNTGTQWGEHATGRRYVINPASYGNYPLDLQGPVNLPSGALLNGLRYYWCSADPNSEIQAWLTWYPEADFTSSTNLTSTLSGAAVGCTSYFQNAAVTIDNYSGQYVVNVSFGAVTPLLDFRGVRLFYHLQVSPAPGASSFSDVPTSHWAFQYIEALAASGITAGCGGGNFCPDTPLTRAQMAVFLSKALGLHWPN